VSNKNKSLACFLAFALGALAKTGAQLVAVPGSVDRIPKNLQVSRQGVLPKTKKKNKILKADDSSKTLVNSKKALEASRFKLFIKSLKEKLLATNFKDFRLLAPFVSIISFILARKYILYSGSFDSPGNEEKNKELVAATSNNNLGEEYEKLKEDYNNLKIENEGYKKLKEDYDTLQKKLQDLLKNNYPGDVVNLKNKADGNKGTYFLLLILFTTSLTLAFYTRFLCIKNKRLSKENKNFSEETLTKGEVIERHRQVEDCMSTFLNTYLPRLESKGKIFEDENLAVGLKDKFNPGYKDVFEELAANKNKKFVKFLLKRVYDNLHVPNFFPVYRTEDLKTGKHIEIKNEENFLRGKSVESVTCFKNKEFLNYIENKLRKNNVLAPKDENTGEYLETIEISGTKITKENLDLVKENVKISCKNVIEIEMNRKTFPQVKGICKDEKTGKLMQFEGSYFEVNPTIMFPSKYNFYASPVNWGKYDEYFKVILPKFYAKMYINKEEETVKKRIVEGFLYGKDDFEYYEDEEHEKIKDEEILERAKFLLIPLMYIDKIDKEYKEDFLKFMREYIIKGNEEIFKKACVGIPGAEEFCKSVFEEVKNKNEENKIENNKNNSILNESMSGKEN